MKRLPILPTLIVAAAVVAMIWLGVWQLRRAEEKEQLLAAMRAETLLPPTIVDCRVDAVPEVRGGRSRSGEPGFRYLVPCNPAFEFKVDIGWSRRRDALRHVRAAGRWAMRGSPTNRDILALERPIPPLSASRVPSPEDIPNNHLFYAVQWFFFAGVAVLIYILALRRRRRELPPEP